MLDKAISQHLRSGHPLYINQGKVSGVLGKPSAIAMQKLGQQHAVDAVILIPEEGLIRNYVHEVPELAWELIEYSEKTLELILPQGIGIQEYFLKEGGHISIRIEAKGAFHKMLYSMGSPLLLLRPISQSDTLPSLSQNDKTLNLPPEFEWKMTPDKIISLGLHGEIKFLKN